MNASPLTRGDVRAVVLERTEEDLRDRWRDFERRVHVIHRRTTVKYAARSTSRGVSVALWSTVANHHRGTAKFPSTKEFSRWSTDAVDYISTVPGEPWWLAQFRTGHGRGNAGTSWTRTAIFAENLYFVPPELADRARDLLPEPPSVWSYYPLLDQYLPRSIQGRVVNWPVARVWTVPADVRRAFAGTDDITEVTRRLFGVKRYRRDLVKAVATADIMAVGFAHQVRGLVPVDTLVRFLSENPRTEGAPREPLPNLRPLLRGLDEQSMRNLMRVENSPFVAASWLADIARMGVPPAGALGRVRTWGDLHDRLVEYRLLHAEAFTPTGKKRRPVKLPEYASALGGKLDDAFSVEIARHEGTLWAWALKMRHCISGYGPAMRSGKSILGGVFDRGVLVANFEVTVDFGDADDPYLRLNQLFGHRNTIVDEALRTRIEVHLVERGVVVPTHYRGARPVPGLMGAA